MIKITEIKTDGEQFALGVISAPLFQWKFNGNNQTAFALGVASSEEKSLKGEYDMLDAKGGNDTFFRYNGKPFASGKRYYATLKVSDGETADERKFCFQTALAPEDWKGDWVNLPVNSQGGSSLYRLRVSVDKPVKIATAYIAGIGYNEFFVNGKKVGDEVLSPATSDFTKRIYYNIYDVSSILQPGDNVFGIEVAHGWLGAKRMLMQVNVTYTDGSETEFHSAVGCGWWVRGGAVRENSIYDGEVYDARVEDEFAPHWASREFEPTWENGWMYTVFATVDKKLLQPQTINPIRVCDEYAPVSTRKSGDKLIVDFGANIAGWAEIEVEGERGASVTIKYGERLDDNGEVNRLNLRSAKATDVYILSGKSTEKWHPRFTYHGFQYAEVTFCGKVELKKIVAKHVHTDTPIIGGFGCSDETLNYLHKIAVRTEHNNEHSILTDCPQRDERFGWLNDLGARLYQTAYNCDMSRFFPKFTGDITDTQLSGGQIGDTAPFYTGGRPADPVCVAYLMMPYLSYKLYGDDAPAKKEYLNLKKWVDFLLSSSDDGIMNYSYYADWVYPICFGVVADKIYVSTVSLYWHLLFMTSIAKIAGNAADGKYYAEKAENLKKTINSHYYNAKTKNYAGGTQTENSMALTLGIAPESDRKAIAENVAKDVIARNYHSTCGNVGYRHLFYVLGEFGYADVAVKMLKNPEFPGWGYMVANGATSVWERWESEMSNEMDSFDHPMFGSYDAFFYAFLGGITVADDACACDKVYIKPVTAGLDSVDCYYDSVRGRIKSSWRKSGDKTVYHVEVPYGVTAEFSAGNVNKTLTYGVYDFEA